MIDRIDWDALFDAAWDVRARAHAPYSGFKVGAAVLTAGGTVVAGCNVENVAFPSSQCAEASAIGTLVGAQGASSILAVVVVAEGRALTWPCGNCRQKLAEFAAGDCQVRVATAEQRSEPVALADLLPHAFDRFESADG